MGVFKPDGSLTWIMISTEPIRDTVTGGPHAVVVSFSDITARKAAEDALSASEARLQLVLEGANDGFWDWNVATGEVLFSCRWAEMLGYDPAEIAPHISSWEGLVHPDDLPRCRAALQAHFSGETPRYQSEYRMRTQNGEWRWILDRGKVMVRDAQGRPLRMAGTHTDITERRTLDESLRAGLAEVERHDGWMVALGRMQDLLLSCETRAEAYTIIARSAGRLFAGYTGALAIVGEERAPGLRVEAAWGDGLAVPTTFPLGDCWALRRGAIHEVGSTRQGTHCRHFSGLPPAAYLCLPLTVRGETLGLLHVSAGPVPQTQVSLGDLRTLAIAVSESVKLALSNIRLQESLREQAIRDPLTGLFNRRYLDETLPRELQLCRRRNEPLAVAMLDLDHFKGFNDAYGHEAGDAALRAVGALLKGSVRAGDIACRYGGEELTLILPGANLDDARVRLEGLRQAITELHLLYQGGELPAITVSIGVAAIGAQETEAAALLARADAALYQAKKAGRNRVVVAAAN
jgi:diguanylate cyclase (GGDEF)-like protein/PAS domain S-box-containing protein